jgi:plastocyanin
MAVRTMLPSKARVGDTIHFTFPHSVKGKKITAFEVMVNGRKISNPEIKMTNAMSGGAISFVFQATAAGTYQFEITPLIDEQRGEPRLNTLEVEE